MRREGPLYRQMKDIAGERTDLCEELSDAIGVLVRSIDPHLIPENGVRMGYALRGARDSAGVAAVRSGIPHPAGACRFGSDETIARIILTAMRFDPEIRAAATLRSSPALITAAESLSLASTPYDAASTAGGISTMDWNVALCCREEIPDLCYPADHGTDAILLGEDPHVVTNNIIMISNRIVHMEL